MQLGHTSQQEDLERETLQADLDLLTTRGRNVNRTRFTEEEAEHLKAIRQIKSALTKFNLSKNEVRVYLFLARFGAQKAQKIAESLSIHRTEAYKILKRLEKQGLVSCIFERPMKFVSIPFEKALENLIEERRQRIHMMEQWKKELMKTWQSLPKGEVRETNRETFQVLEGRRQMSVKATRLLEGCSNEIIMLLTDENLLWLYNSPFFEDLDQIADERGIDVKVLTNFSPTITYVLEEINLGKGDFAYKEVQDSPCFIISDNGQMLLLMENEQDDSKTFAIWTNYTTLVKSFRMLFKLIWSSQSDTIMLTEEHAA